ncbi:MAG: DUF6089 family protein [Porphyromonadaceae bacterium]|nr:DUF6089 family protein [Porphyromonadaceae bacterium]
MLPVLVWGWMLLSQTYRVSAQEYLYELGGRLGVSHYMGDAARRGFIAPYASALSLLGRRNINFRWAWVAELGYRGLRGDTRYADNVFPEGHTARFSAHLVNLRLGSEFNFLPLSDKYRYLGTSSFSPYVGAGIGGSLVWRDRVAVPTLGVYLAVGAKYKLNARLSLGAEWQWQYTWSDRLDALNPEQTWLSNPYGLNASWVKGRDAFAVFSLGLTYQLRQRKQGQCD